MPSDEVRRMAFIEMLPTDVQTHVTMHMDEPEFNTYNKVKKYVLRYVKVCNSRKTKGRVR